MPDRLVTTWFGPKMPRLHALCVASWLEVGYEAVVYSYRDAIDGLPPGATLVDGAEVLSQDKMFFLRGGGAYAHFSDIFRMELLRRGLGIWCDADFMLLRPLPEFDEILIGEERGGWPCNAVMGLTPEHPIALGVLENFEKPPGMADWTLALPRWRAFFARMAGQPFTIADLPHGHWGRHALDYYVTRLGLRHRLLSQDAFYAEETYTGELFQPKPFDRLLDAESVYGLHFFAKPTSAADAPLPGSFFAWAEDRFGPRLG